jgi:N utilization substance protein B
MAAGGFGSRRRAREQALQALYALDLNDALSPAQALAYVRREVGPGEGDAPEDEPAVIQYAEVLVAGTTGHLGEIDEIVQKASRNWRLERMARVDRNLLRLATYELRFAPEVPAKVVINEAIEVAKRFGAGESPAFVNGLLDRISQELKRV